MCQDIKFVTDSRDHWKYVDMMVTDHPDVIMSKSEGKTCIIVDKQFNHKIGGLHDSRITSIKELGEKLLELEEPVQS